MQQPPAFRPSAFMVALALLFSGLLLSLAVLPTLTADPAQACAAAPAPAEEEQLHGRDVHKTGTVPDRSWCCASLLLGRRVSAAFRDGDVTLPHDPISEVLLRPPKAA